MALGKFARGRIADVKAGSPFGCASSKSSRRNEVLRINITSTSWMAQIDDEALESGT
jgi:hypothetical protein